MENIFYRQHILERTHSIEKSQALRVEESYVLGDFGSIHNVGVKHSVD